MLHSTENDSFHTNATCSAPVLCTEEQEKTFDISVAAQRYDHHKDNGGHLVKCWFPMFLPEDEDPGRQLLPSITDLFQSCFSEENRLGANQLEKQLLN